MSKMGLWKYCIVTFLHVMAFGAETFGLTNDVLNTVCSHKLLCSRNNTVRSPYHHGDVPTCCSTCSCEPRCHLSRDCCPDAPVDAPVTSAQADPQYEKYDLKCLPLEDILSEHIQPKKRLVFKPHYLTIQSCPKGYVDETNIDGCLNAEQFPKLADHVPVFNWKTFELYRNYHCAICNNVTDPIPWKLESTCLALYERNKPPETILELRSATESCEVLFKPPEYIKQEFKLCRTDSYEDIIKSCNQSGHWYKYDDDLSETCNLESFVSYFVTQQQQPAQESNMIVYKNPACFLCNSNESTRENVTCLAENKWDENTELLPFKVTINVDTFVYIEMKAGEKSSQPRDEKKLRKQGQSCGVGRYMDPYKKICREMRCPVDQYAVEGLCLKKNVDVDHLPVAVKLAVRIIQAPTTEYITDSIARKFVQSMNKTINEKLFKTCAIRRSVISVFPNTSVDVVLVRATVVTTNDCSVSYLLAALKQIDPDVGKPLHIFDGDFRYDIGITYEKYILDDDLDLELVKGSDTDTIHLTRLFHCPRVLLSTLQYKEAVKSGVFDYLHDSDSDYVVERADSNTVEVCISDYEHKYLDELFFTDEKPTGYSVLTIVSAVCTILSMICLIITLITFAIFKDLRFMPGKMFVMLCVNVLIAQLLFQFGMGVGGYGPLCVTLGIIVHYFWLAVAFSMNSCILLMYNHFHSPLKISTRSVVLTQRDAKVEMGKYAAYTYSCPLIFVLANIMISLIMTDNKSMGYGGQFCYIDTRLMRGLVFALPLGLIILINFGLFSRVLYDIMKIKVQHLKAESDNICSQFAIFLKFSTITGIYWSFGFFYEITELECFGYIYVLLNAGQGICLMASFLFNRKVFQLYKGLCANYAERFKSKALISNTRSREDNNRMIVESEA